MQAAAALDLSKIYSSPVFRSRSSVDSHRELCSALIGHRLRWGRGEVATTLYRRELTGISLQILAYGAEVEITPDPFEDFILVQIPLRGTAEVESDGTVLQIERGDIAVLAPKKSARLLWRSGCEQLIVKVPNALLRQAALGTSPQVRYPSAPSAECPAWTMPVFKVAPVVARQWLALMQQLLTLLPPENHPDTQPPWLNPLEQTAALFLQSHQMNSARSTSTDPLAPAGASSARADDTAAQRLRRLEAYIRSRPFAPLSLADLAHAAGVTTRTLNTLCHRYRGVSPMELLRNLRLEGAREELLANQEASVTQVALEYGFGHLGRFSAYYRERFGELPRQTTKRTDS